MFCGNFDDSSILTNAYRLCELLLHYDNNPVFLCVGNSNIVADCFGPLVGQFCKCAEIGDVYGCVDSNISEKNLIETFEYLKKLNQPIVVVDATTSNIDFVGSVGIYNHGCIPAIGKNNKIMGQCSILGYTNVGGIDGMTFLRTTKFDMVLKMASFTALVIEKSLELLQIAKSSKKQFNIN